MSIDGLWLAGSNCFGHNEEPRRSLDNLAGFGVVLI